MTNSLHIGKASKYIGQSPSNPRQLEQTGAPNPDTYTAGGHRRYSFKTIDQLLSSSSTRDSCLTFLRIPDTDFPADDKNRLLARLNQVLIGMCLSACEDYTPSIYEGGLYTLLPKLLTRVTARM
jgi:hypothetical protein